MTVLWFDGLLAQLNDAGVYFLPEDDIAELREAAAVNCFRCLRVDLFGCTGKACLLARLAEALQLPGHFGQHWNALADALAEMRVHDTKGLVLLLENSDDLRRDAVAEFKTAAEVLQAASGEWAARKSPLWTFIALPEAEFDALG